MGAGQAYVDAFKKFTGADDTLRSQVASGVEQVARGEVPSFYLEYATGPSDGNRWRTLRATRFREVAPVRVVVVHDDITDRKRAEDSLRRSEADYREIIQNALYGMFRASPQGRFLMANPAMVEILGYDSEEELLAIESMTVLWPGDEAGGEALQSLIDAEHMVHYPVTWTRKDGHVASLLLSGHPVQDASGEITFFEIMVEDVTERLTLEEQLRQSQRLEALGQLAGGVAHDFNNILSVIIIEAQLGMRRLDEDDPVWKRLDEIKKAGDRATALTSQLLAFSRKQVIKPTTLNLNQLISGMHAMLTRLISEDIELNMGLAKTLDNVLADGGRLEQIVANLVVNARDSMTEGGVISIRTAMQTPTVQFRVMYPNVQAEAVVVLEVQDSGSGIPDEVKAKMFDPFFTTKERGKGTGLGLATVYGIVQRMGGAIDVESALGTGTTMTIYLPASEEVETEEIEMAENGSRSSRGSETLMVVEDDARLRRIAVELLKEQGYTVLSCEDGSTALRSLESYDDPVHLLLTDVVMPKMGGRELAERVQESRTGIKVLFMSGYTDDKVLEQKIVSGGISFLPKPFTAESLALAVRNVLDDGGPVEA